MKIKGLQSEITSFLESFNNYFFNRHKSFIFNNLGLKIIIDKNCFLLYNRW